MPSIATTNTTGWYSTAGWDEIVQHTRHNAYEYEPAILTSTSTYEIYIADLQARVGRLESIILRLAEQLYECKIDSVPDVEKFL